MAIFRESGLKEKEREIPRLWMLLILMGKAQEGGLSPPPLVY